MIAHAINEIYVLPRLVMMYLYAAHAGTLVFLCIPPIHFLFSLTYFLNLSLNPLYIVLYYYIIFRQSLVTLFDIIVC